MKRIEIKLDYWPAITEIAKTWDDIFSKASKTIKRNEDLNYFGGLIFANSMIKRKEVAILEEKFGEVAEKEYPIPEMAVSISKKHVCVFEILSNYPDDTLEAEVYLIFSKDKKYIERMLCIDHVHEAYHWVDDIGSVLEFLDCSATLIYLQDFQSTESI